MLFGFELNSSLACAVGVGDSALCMVGFETVCQGLVALKPKFGRSVVGDACRLDPKRTHVVDEVDSVPAKTGNVPRDVNVPQPPGPEFVATQSIPPLQEDGQFHQ